MDGFSWFSGIKPCSKIQVSGLLGCNEWDKDKMRALDFQKLIDLGLIERKGKGKTTYYVLREE